MNQALSSEVEALRLECEEHRLYKEGIEETLKDLRNKATASKEMVDRLLHESGKQRQDQETQTREEPVPSPVKESTIEAPLPGGVFSKQNTNTNNNRDLAEVARTTPTRSAGTPVLRRELREQVT